MIRLLRRLFLFGCLLACLTAGAGWLWFQYERHRDPMPLLERGPAFHQVLADRQAEGVTQDGERRSFHDITLDGGRAGIVQFTVSLPRSHRGRMPVLVILGGLEIGRESLGYIGRHGANALVAYQYPGSREPWYEGSPLRKAPAVRRSALEVPAQVDVLLAWLLEQSWSDPARTSLMGYSFGAVFLPSALHLAQARGRRLGPTVLAYGGADLPSLLAANLDLHPRWLRTGLAEGLAVLVRPLEPALHLPYLQGEFLFINGRRDPLIPPANAAAMQALVTGPRQVVWLDAGHMNPGDPLLLGEIIHRCREWLMARRALEP